MSEIKPCKKCGENALILLVTASADCRGGFVIGCANLSCEESSTLFQENTYIYKEDAVSAWNRRADDDCIWKR